MNHLMSLSMGVLTLLVTGIGFATSYESIVENTDQKTDIESLLKEHVDENDGIGMAVGLIDHGKVSYFAYGKKAKSQDDPITEDSLFEIGSITKVFTALALMDLVEKGNMQLDEPIENYLKNVKVPELAGKKITLRHLATHTSGFPRTPDNLDCSDLTNPFPNYSADDLYQFLNGYTLKKTPGEHFEYSNLSIGLLGHILSLHSHMSYEDLIQENICNKLGMQNTVITISSSMKDQLTTGHHMGKEVPHWEFLVLQGAGALRSNVKDMTAFLAANLGSENSPLTKLLNKCHERQFPFSETTAVGLGWQIAGDIIWHGGGTGGYRSYLGFNPKNQRGIVVFTNSTEDCPDELTLGFLDPENYKRPIVDKSLRNDLSYLKLFTGVFDMEIPGVEQKPELQIMLYGKQLIAISSAGMTFIRPEQYGIFGFKGLSDYKCQFIFDENKKIMKVQGTGPSGVIWEAFPNPEKALPTNLP